MNDWHHSSLRPGDRLRPRAVMLELLQRGCAVDPSTGCWVWTRQKNKHGYGHVCVGSRRNDSGKTVGIGAGAHRVSYELRVGPVPCGLHLDHLCRNRACINPAHLEPVTPKENVARGDTNAKSARLSATCKRGHLFIAETTRLYPGGGRACKICISNTEGTRKRARRTRPPTKLTQETAVELRGFWAVGGWSRQELADAYGIHEKTTYRVLVGKSWKGLEDR